MLREERGEAPGAHGAIKVLLDVCKWLGGTMDGKSQIRRQRGGVLSLVDGGDLRFNHILRQDMPRKTCKS